MPLLRSFVVGSILVEKSGVGMVVGEFVEWVFVGDGGGGVELVVVVVGEEGEEIEVLLCFQ